MTEVTLSNNQIVNVRRLGLFELDDYVERRIPEPFTVTILFQNGEIYEQPYDLSVVREAPAIPFEDCEENTAEWYQWREHMRYQEGLLHEQRRYETYADYCRRVAEYIHQTCIIGDLDRCALTPEDWQAIEHAALCPQVTMEEVSAAIAANFPGDL